MTAVTVCLERGAMRTSERLEFRPRGDLVFRLPRELGDQRGRLQVTIGINGDAVSVGLRPDSVRLLGERVAPWTTLLGMLGLSCLTALPVLLLAFALLLLMIFETSPYFIASSAFIQ